MEYFLSVRFRVTSDLKDSSYVVPLVFAQTNGSSGGGYVAIRTDCQTLQVCYLAIHLRFDQSVLRDH